MVNLYHCQLSTLVFFVFSTTILVGISVDERDRNVGSTPPVGSGYREESTQISAQSHDLLTSRSSRATDRLFWPSATLSEIDRLPPWALGVGWAAGGDVSGLSGAMSVPASSFIEEATVKKEEGDPSLESAPKLGDPRGISDKPQTPPDEGIILPRGKRFSANCGCARPFGVPLTFKLPMQYPGGCAASEIKIKRLQAGDGYDASDIDAAIEVMKTQWVKVDETHLSGIEGRTKHGVIGTPGGDMAEFIVSARDSVILISRGQVSPPHHIVNDAIARCPPTNPLVVLAYDRHYDSTNELAVAYILLHFISISHTLIWGDMLNVSEFIFQNALDVFEEMVHFHLSDGHCLWYLRRFLQMTKKYTFFMSTDTLATKTLQVSLGMKGYNIRDTPDPRDWNRVLDEISLPEHVGNAHIRAMIMKPDEYDVRPGLPRCALRAFYTLLWNKREPMGRKLRLVELPGDQAGKEKAFLKISSSKTCVKMGLAPLVVPKSDAGTFFVSHFEAAENMRRELSRFFARFHRWIDSKRFFDKMQANAKIYERLAIWRMARLTLNLPVYSVQFR